MNADAFGALAFDAAQAAGDSLPPLVRDWVFTAGADRDLAGAGRFPIGCKLRGEPRARQLVADGRLPLGHLAAARFVKNFAQGVSFVLVYQSIQPATLIWQSRYSLATSMWFISTFSPGVAFGNGGHFTSRFACGIGAGFGIGFVPKAQAVSVKHTASARVLA